MRLYKQRPKSNRGYLQKTLKCKTNIYRRSLCQNYMKAASLFQCFVSFSGYKKRVHFLKIRETYNVLFVDSKLLTVLPWQWYLAQQQVSIYIPS